MSLRNKKSRMWVAIGALAGLALVFAGGFGAARWLAPDVVYRGGNPTLETAQIDSLQANGAQAPAVNERNMLQALQNASRAVADSSLPVVVRIEIEKNVKVGNTGNPFQFFFNGQPWDPNGENQGTPPGGNQGNGSGNNQNKQDNSPTQKQGGFGSGIIIEQKDTSYFVLTNNHVVDGADKFVVRTFDNKSFDAKLVGADKNRDLAVISFVSKDRLPLARLGDSAQVRAGDIVYAVGSPYGIQNTVTQGIISAIGRTSNDLPTGGDTTSGFTDYLQTDAAINPGNSGGALVNINGEVIGINTWIATRTGENVGLGFAVPINNAKKVASDFITKGKVEYGWLGIRTGNIIDETRDALKLAKDQPGAFAFSVIKNSPAEKSGLLPGDVITEVNNVAIKTADDLIRNISGLDVNSEVTVKLIRNGSSITMKVKLGLRDDKADMSSWPGFTVIPMTDDIRNQLKLSGSTLNNRTGRTAKPLDVPNGTLIVFNVDDSSNAAEAGLKQGDIISAISGQAIKNVGDFYLALGKNQSKNIQLTIQRNGKEITLSFQR